MIKAALFDMDGLLADTETVGVEVVKKICKSVDLPLKDGEEHGVIGVTFKKFYKDLIAKRKTNHDLEEILKKNYEVYEDLISKECKCFDGALSLPKIFKERGLKLGIVSGSTRKQIGMVLNSFGIKDFFDVIVSSLEDVEHSKPDPAGYLLAAQKLNIKPAECLVLEDSMAGVKAGKAAHMKVVGVVHNGGQDISEADFRVNNLMEVEKNINKFLQ